MARLLQAVLPLLLLASLATAETKEERIYREGKEARAHGHKKYNEDQFKDLKYVSDKDVNLTKNENGDLDFSNDKIDIAYFRDTSYESLGNDEARMDFLEALLVAKTCFRDWIRDDDCMMKNYEVAKAQIDKITDAKKKANALADARKNHPVGADSHYRLKRQLDDLKKIQSDTKKGDYFVHVTKALRENFLEMVDKAAADEADMQALRSHLGSEEFKIIFNNLKKDLKNEGFTEDDFAKANYMSLLGDWIEEEKKKSENGELNPENYGWGRDAWTKMMNKIPDTAKYLTRGATPFSKKHLAAHLRVMDSEKYHKLKQKSSAYLMAKANQMRHEAMEKSNSIIAYVMHKMLNGKGANHDMKDMAAAMGNSAQMDKVIGHSDHKMKM